MFLSSLLHEMQIRLNLGTIYTTRIMLIEFAWSRTFKNKRATPLSIERFDEINAFHFFRKFLYHFEASDEI